MSRFDDEEGLSLVELIVYIVVLGILAGGLSLILVNMWKTQAKIDAQTRGTDRGQLISSQIERAIRNATGFRVADGGTTLLVETSLASSQQCQSFHFDPNGGVDSMGSLGMSLTPAPAPSASAGYAWQDGVTIYSDARFSSPFTSVDQSGNPTATNVAGLHYSFAAESADPSIKSGPVSFTGTVYPRNATMEGTSGCWP